MAQIEVIRDPQIQQTKIIHALRTEEAEGLQNENGEVTSTETQQTKVFGQLVPLLALNSVAVDWNDVLSFTLDDTAHIPACKFIIKDRQSIFARYSHLGNDNELRVQIIPQFDDTYKKIDLTFLITDIKIKNGQVSGTAIYNLKPFTEARFKALGQISTYELADKISLDTGLGFSANIQTTEDKRYMQCSFESYKDIISREIEKSGSGETNVYDWWIDCWNNLILCDLYDRINNEDSEDDMTIWAADQAQDSSTNFNAEPVEMVATLSNHPMFERSDLYVYGYDVDNKPVTATKGNSFAISVYEENKKECIDHYITDGDTIKNEFTKFEYLGEVYGDYNYFLAEKARKVYLSKIKSEVVVVHIPNPQLGIMRGSQCRFIWYDNDTFKAANQDAYEKVGAIAGVEDLKQQIGWLADWIPEKTNDDFPLRLNLQYSGQYTSIGQYITYDGSKQNWDCWLYLVRPASKRPKISQIDQDENNSNL